MSGQGTVSSNQTTVIHKALYAWRRIRYALRHVLPSDGNGNPTSHGLRTCTYDHADRLTQLTGGSLTIESAYNGDGVRTRKTVAGDTTEYVVDLAATLPVVISDIEAAYLHWLDIVVQQQTERLYYMRDGQTVTCYPVIGSGLGVQTCGCDTHY
jgi:hypothetical protein